MSKEARWPEPAEVLQALGIDTVPAILTDSWKLSAQARRAIPVDWLSESSLREACGRIGLLAETTEACVSTAETVRSSPALLAFAWHGWWVIFQSGLDVRPSIDEWPLPGELAGGQAPRLPPLFWAVVLLAGAEVAFRRNRERGVPDPVTAATLRDLDLWIHECRLRTGRTGFLELCWLVYHFCGRLFALGRLHFDMRANDVGFHVLRRPASTAEGSEYVALAEDGMRFRPDGQFENADRSISEQPWTTSFSSYAGRWRGFPVESAGAVRSSPADFPRPAWSETVAPDSPVLGVHIPAAGPFHGPMTPEACDESFHQAKQFFSTHFPGHVFRGFTCKSWILDSQLARYLPASSNIVRFQKRFLLLPVRGANDAQTIERVYGVPLARTQGWDWRAAPRDTSMREVLVSHVIAGGRWRMGGGIIPAN